MTKKLSKEYIIGLVEGQGSFTFTTWRKKERKIPTFKVKMNVENADLMELVKESMGLSNKVYRYNHQGKDNSKRKPYAILIVREIGVLKNIVVPLFYNQFKGVKKAHFSDWIEKIGSDPWIPDSYKIIYRLHRNGYYKNNPKKL